MNDAAAAPAADPDLHGRTVWAIDTLSRIYQLFHALPEMAAPDGTPVSAVFGFTRDLLDIIENRRPDYLFCAIDAPGPTFRHEKFAAYKANRPDMPADLVPQIPLIRRLLDVMGIPCLERSGFEADDLLATLATRTVSRGGDCIIATSDKDARQLLGDHVRLYNLRTNAPFGTAELQADWGIGPGQVVDFLSLVGDAVDNVPGVPGIGPKIAGELLQRYGTLDELLAHVDEVNGAKRRENLAAHAGTARAGRELIRLDTAAPLDLPWDAGLLHQPDAARLADFLRELGFRSLLARVKGAGPSQSRPAAGDAGAAAPAASKPGTPQPGTPQLAASKPRRAPGTLFDLDGDDESAAADASTAAGGPATPDVVIATDEPQIAAVVARLRAAPPVVVCVCRDAAGTSMSPPLGLALAAGGLTVWADADRLAASPSIRDLLADPAVSKQGHDLKAQEVAVRAAGMRIAGAAFDTLLAAYLLEAGERNLGLTETALRHDLIPADAVADAATTGLDRPTAPADAARHCAIVGQLADLLPARLAAAGLEPLYRDVELPLAGVLADMECRGVRIDTAALAALSADYTVRLADLEREVQALAGRPFSLASPVQVRAVLFTDLGLPVVKRTKTGPSTDADVLEELAPLHPLPAKLLEHRKFAKLKSTYVDALPALVNAKTGRIHTSFNQTVTATGRLSSSDPNLQNIPIRTAEGQQIRAAFLPGVAGWRFVAADYSQVELRILAHLSGDAVMKRAFAGGEDIHARTAAEVFGVPPADVTPAMRRTAKAVNFGILYGQSGFGLAKALSIPQDEATAFIAAYFRTFAGAAAFMDDVLDRCRRDGHVTTMLGRRRAIAGVRDRDRRRAATGGFALTLPERTAVNTVVQGSAADLIKLAMLRVHRRLAAAGLEAALVLQIHDELLLECPPEEVAAVTAILVEEMQGAMTLDVPLDVSAHAGDTWAECHA